jgi:hypothetical protein
MPADLTAIKAALADISDRVLVVLQTRVILRVGADWPDAGVTTH